MNTFVVFSSLILSVLLGGFLVVALQQNNKTQVVKLLLAFSGGFLLSIAFMHFIPDLYHSETPQIGLYILIGFLVQLVLEYFSGGVEHGHVHVHKGQAMPWALFLSLSIHSLIEGIPLGNQLVGMDLVHIDGHTHSHANNTSFLLGILFHQVPVAIALMTLLMATRLKQFQSWIILTLFGLTTPIGVLVGMYVPAEEIGLNYHVILAVVVGIFLHISTTIIFETNENHKFNFMKLVSILVGFGLALVII